MGPTSRSSGRPTLRHISMSMPTNSGGSSRTHLPRWYAAGSAGSWKRSRRAPQNAMGSLSDYSRRSTGPPPTLRHCRDPDRTGRASKRSHRPSWRRSHRDRRKLGHHVRGSASDPSWPACNPARVVGRRRHSRSRRHSRHPGTLTLTGCCSRAERYRCRSLTLKRSRQRSLN